MGRTVYFTTPLYYVNAEPHIGHLYTTVLADTLKRYQRLVGDDVYFLTGTDEHGEKIAETAAQQGTTAAQLADRVAGVFRDTWQEIGLEFDDFIRTTEQRHKTYVQQVLKRVHDAGDIYFDEYTGLYCVGCERYLTETELVGGKCPDHQVEPKQVEEANYFFRMSKYQQQLIDHIEENPTWIRPERYRNEVRSFLRQPLEDLCISRPKTRLTWGIDLPFDDKFVTYVWFDALLNYVSALKTTSGGADLYDRYWEQCNHLIAKDILKTHAIYWPTMLMAAGIPLFKQIDVHGYWLSGDSKMSKSLGNVVRPLSFDRQFGIENLRYFFFREMKFGTDASFTYELFVERYNSDLANGLGNLLSRVASIVKKNLGGAIPEEHEVPPPGERGGYARTLKRYAAKLTDPDLSPDAVLDEGSENPQRFGPSYQQAFENRQFHLAVERIRGLLTSTDWWINEMEPWKLAKATDDESKRLLQLVLYNCLEVVRIAAILLSPVMPGKCREILAYLGEDRPLDGSVPWKELTSWGGLKPGHVIGDVPRVFPRIDEKKLEQVMAEAAPVAAAASGAGEADVEPIGEEITIDDFAKLDLRVGVVREASLVEGAKKLVRLLVDIGEDKPRQVFAGIRSAYPEPGKLVGQQVVMLANLKPRKMKFGLSEGMILAGHSPDETRMCTATLDRDLKPGDRVT